MNAFCTHLVGPVPRVNLRPDNAQQIQELVSFVNSKVRGCAGSSQVCAHGFSLVSLPGFHGAVG